MDRKRAFTLIELLVVIAILSLLVSLLMPSLKKARQLAQSMSCLSNLRNISMWAVQYTYDNEEWLPHNGQSGWEWSYSELSNTPWMLKCRDWSSDKKKHTYFYCPSAKIQYADNQHDAAWESTTCNYGLNDYLGGYKFWWDSAKTKALWPRASLLKPYKFWFGDTSVKWGSWGTPGWYFPTNLALASWGNPWIWQYPEYEGHPNLTANFLFCDGHAEGITLDQWQGMTSAEKNRIKGDPWSAL